MSRVVIHPAVSGAPKRLLLIPKLSKEQWLTATREVSNFGLHFKMKPAKGRNAFRYHQNVNSHPWERPVAALE